MKSIFNIFYSIIFLAIAPISINRAQTNPAHAQEITEIDTQLREAENSRVTLKNKLDAITKEMDSIPDKVSSQYQNAFIRYNATLSGINLAEERIEKLNEAKSHLQAGPLQPQKVSY